MSYIIHDFQYTIHDFQQGSQQWLAHRSRSNNASDLAAALGVSPYKRRSTLVHEIATGITQEIDAATQRRFDKGHRFEKLARPLAEGIIGRELYPIIVSVTIDGLRRPLSASLDGATDDDAINWEHKTLNDDLAAALVRGIIPDEHHPQMEQGMFINGANRTLFMASRWDENNELIEEKHCWYESCPELRAKIIPTWKQMEADAANYQHTEAAQVVVGHAPESLPALRIEVTGIVTASNLSEFRSNARSVIGAIKTDLQTDEDFASAEKTVKWCGEVEERLDAAKQHALSQTASIDELFRAIDQIKAEARAKRLELDKLVKTRKEAIRAEIVRVAQDVLRSHIESLNQRLGKPYLPAQDMMRFGAAIKGLKTLASLRDAVATELAHAKIEANEVADKIEMNIKTLRELAPDHAFLFADTAQLVLKANDDLTAIVKARIADHKAAEEKRLESERERIRREEQAKAEAAARQNVSPEPRLATLTGDLIIGRSPSAPMPVLQTQVGKATAIDAYLATLNDGPKKKAEIRKYIIAFLEFCAQREAA